MSVKINAYGEINVHIGSANSDHLTLCGMDGGVDDEYTVGAIDHKVLKSAKNDKINCKQCIAIWKTCRTVKPKQIDELFI